MNHLPEGCLDAQPPGGAYTKKCARRNWMGHSVGTSIYLCIPGVLPPSTQDVSKVVNQNVCIVLLNPSRSFKQYNLI